MSKHAAKPTPVVCLKCGKSFEWKSRGRPPRHCPDCAAAKTFASASRRGVFAGMSMEKAAALARQHHMTYGTYRALAEAQGRLDVKTEC